MTYQLPIYSDEQLSEATSYPPLECGRYRFKVISIEQGTSKNNNHQEKLILEVYHNANKPMRCYHNFTFNNPGDPGHLWLIGLAKLFLDAIGAEYTPDAFERVLNREGEANFLVDTYEKNGETREKFVIPNDGFKEDSVLPSPKKNNVEVTEFKDDIPF